MRFDSPKDRRARSAARRTTWRDVRRCDRRGDDTSRPDTTAPVSGRPWWHLMALLLVLAHSASAQQEPVSERAFFAPIEVSLVNVDVFAADGSGHPVRGLISSDFEILEDGEPVAVTHFYAAPGVSRYQSGAVPAIFAENVSRVAIDQAANDCESMGYKTKAISLSAKDLGGDHIRERFWLLAYSDDNGKLLRTINAETRWMPKLDHGVWESDARSTRVSDGMASRMDRLKATGNGQVPIVAAAAWEILSDQR